MWWPFQIGHRDSVAPAQISSNISRSVYSTSLSFKWQPVTDDTNGTGVFRYEVYRNASLLGYTDSGTTVFTDKTAVPGTAYTYSFDAVDWHGNASTLTTISLTSPPNTAVDPRHQGVSGTGAYWGGGGEQIDMQSGNLNFSVPLVTAQGRTGWKVPVGLSYNSQNWRQEGSATWRLGGDTGFGFGWRMAIGSVTPYYANWAAGVDHYRFTNGSGAEYRLDQNSGGVWSSLQGLYVWFDANTNILYFKDGTFWVMGALSGGLEDDAGTLYPTVIEDVSRNQVMVRYASAVGLPATNAYLNTCSRIQAIEDARAPGGAGSATYTMTYSGYPLPHLTGVSNTISSGETATVSNTTGAMNPPFGTDADYTGLTTSRLTSIYTPAGWYQFAYDTAGASELTRVTFPTGGQLKWDYQNFQYAGSRTLREVSARYVAANPASLSTLWTYSVTHPDASNAVALHTAGSVTGATPLDGVSAPGVKTWSFLPAGTTPAWKIGLISDFTQKAYANSSTALAHDVYSWAAATSNGNPYIAAKTSIVDEGTANQLSLYSTQVADANGNVTQAVTYPFNNTSTPLRTYNSVYLGTSAYTLKYILNRVLSVTMTTGGTTKTLVQNYYDGRVTSGQPAYPGGTVCSARDGSGWQLVPTGPNGVGPEAQFDVNPGCGGTIARW